ncbi:unnamed protein product [Angiostrongylus costaricensis]|uniref:Uncharacterized protein n=1 Tax=Angiostrongylus costaricensis TaxID=334426 RepID=A0A0R3PCL6_ANGCS|nr:unnamed protein product [Angiostrongylus costaricensis]
MATKCQYHLGEEAFSLASTFESKHDSLLAANNHFSCSVGWFRYVTFPEKQAWIIGYRTDCVIWVRIAQLRAASSPRMIGEEIDRSCGGQYNDDIDEDMDPLDDGQQCNENLAFDAVARHHSAL